MTILIVAGLKYLIALLIAMTVMYLVYERGSRKRTK